MLEFETPSCGPTYYQYILNYLPRFIQPSLVVNNVKVACNQVPQHIKWTQFGQAVEIENICKQF